ncbi:MAG TPA: single-stranded-DNA-specific exonuclease RecJ [Burkholderiaceae bacterium]|nr:single-stranded-DNA-specific exonuclease RecJ [Burkholderiaceae bacterium]
MNTSVPVHIRHRSRDAHAESRLIEAGLHPLVARLLAARGLSEPPLRRASQLLAPDGLRGIDRAATRLADAIVAREPMLVVGDYDCDGATACAVAVRGLRALGARVDYLVPNRFKSGYGLTPAIVELAVERAPRVIVTVDNGIASIEGVATANALGIDVVVTDHHLPGGALPAACAIVNPNQPGCTFRSKAVAGVGVVFYVLIAVRAELRKRGLFTAETQPRLDGLLDLVALGTVADLVKLDANNRLFVQLGLERIRGQQAQPGVLALARVAGRDPRALGVADLGFALGPRLNAAGRLADMTIGIECLLADDPARAYELALVLDRMNAERRELQHDMLGVAMEHVARVDVGASTSIVLHDPAFHAGVTGLVAGRLKDLHHRPTIVFATSSDGRLTGSGRSIPGFHMRDAIDLVTKRAPGLIERFGGHAMAAGLTIPADALAPFTAAFEAVAQALLGGKPGARELVVDGPIESAYVSPAVVRLLDAEVWGQGFEPPLFHDTWRVLSQRVIKDRHLKLVLERDGQRLEGIAFGRVDALPQRADLAFRITTYEYNGLTSAQLVVEHAA